MNLFQKYSSPEGWQEDIDLYENRLNLLKEQIEYWEKEKETETLQKEIKHLKENLDTLNKRIQDSREERNNELLKQELRTICERFRYLGFRKGISQKEFDLIYKEFWLSMVNRYFELQKNLEERMGIWQCFWLRYIVLMEILTRHMNS